MKFFFKVSVLAGADSSLQNIAFQFGRQLGMAFQLVDDVLDFVATSAQLGKPAAADLRLGLATAPVLFAAHKVLVYQVLSAISKTFSKTFEIYLVLLIIVS